jgi:hypothetical protein
MPRVVPVSLFEQKKHAVKVSAGTFPKGGNNSSILLCFLACSHYYLYFCGQIKKHYLVNL